MKEAKLFLNNLLCKNDTIVVATSGGPDSMCLLHVINSLKVELSLNIICAHVNHGLRKESIDEAEFVKKYCLDNNIFFEYMIIDKYKNDKFTEEEGRKKRYSFFADLVKKYNAKYLMTAHHGDDLIETILMRIVRGSNLKGYIGIPKITYGGYYTIVRPLLYLSKEEIYDYLDKNNIKYVIDKSNESLKYTRNRYRKQMLPFLKSEDINVHKKFLKYSEELEKNNNYLNKLINAKFLNIVNNKVVDINKLKEEDEFIQEKIIEKLIEEIQKIDIFDISKEQFKSICNLINSNNKKISLNNGYIARKSYNLLCIEKDNKDIINYEYELKDKLAVLNKYLFEMNSDNNSKSNYIIRLNSKEITLPLIVRNKQDGDVIRIKNLGGRKKIKDIFINSKIDKEKRGEYPIVVDSKNVVLWIPGLKKSIFDKNLNEKYDIIIKCTEGNYE